MWLDAIEATGGWLSDGRDAMRVHIFQGGDGLYGFTLQDAILLALATAAAIVYLYVLATGR
jgi:hypothetical protein